MACVISPIIKVTEMCNFDCVFCRYSNHKQNTGIMNVDIVKKILEESAEINAETNQKVKVLFHGGEPLLWGIERFYEIYEYEKELSDKFRSEPSTQIFFSSFRGTYRKSC